MVITELVLALGALGFAWFGVWLIVDPAALGKVGLRVDNGEARAEVRAMYGGLELGIAAFLAISIFRDEWLAGALTFQLLALGGLAAGRLLGVVMEGGRVSGLMKSFVAIEIAAAALTYYALTTV